MKNENKARKQYKCKHPSGCEKWAQTGGLCADHGGKKLKCKHPEGCEKWARKGGFCIAHGESNKELSGIAGQGAEEEEEEHIVHVRHFIPAEPGQFSPVPSHGRYTLRQTHYIGPEPSQKEKDEQQRQGMVWLPSIGLWAYYNFPQT